ncbi:MAG: (2Fe-2S) ferredoxin domain-containing protein [Bacteroidales bacterium]|jgi:NADH:ubiquinone oxidoreductase subunit E|nr:(2Fe-2S) ferredoxin domain-containing protein [Bacteroidales bacterium]
MIIKVCVGSSCHLKGSYDVIDQMKALLKKYDVEEQIELQASFCLGFCSKGVTVKAGPAVEVTGQEGLFLHNVNKDNVEDLFVKEIIPLLTI